MDAKIKLLAQELLFETVGHYNLSNRGYDTTQGCVYVLVGDRPADDKHCAAGRIMTPEGLQKIRTRDMNSGKDIIEVIQHLGIDIIRERWRPLLNDVDGRAIVKKIQSLHDTEENWNESGLTKRGVNHALGVSRLIWEAKMMEPELA